MNFISQRTASVLALAGVCFLPPQAHADLGKIEILSNPGERFTAFIPLITLPDELYTLPDNFHTLPDDAVTLGLADPNQFPVLLPYSPSAELLEFSLQKRPDGSPYGILVRGPSEFSEPRLRFAVNMSWDALGLVREYEVDYQHEGPLWNRNMATLGTNDTQGAEEFATKQGIRAEPNRVSSSSSEGHPNNTIPDRAPLPGQLDLGPLKISSTPGEPLHAQAQVLGVTPTENNKLSVRVVLADYRVKDAPSFSRLIASITPQLMWSQDSELTLQLNSTEPVLVPQFAFDIDIREGEKHLVKRYTLTSKLNGFSVDEIGAEPSVTVAMNVWHVKWGDTLFAIARHLARPPMGLYETMHRLATDNPQAFIRGDINKLLAGATLRYPADWGESKGIEHAHQKHQFDLHNSLPPLAKTTQKSSNQHEDQPTEPTKPKPQTTQKNTTHQQSSAPQHPPATLPQRPARPIPGFKPFTPLHPPNTIPLMPNAANSLPQHKVSDTLLIEGIGALVAAAGVACALLLRRKYKKNSLKFDPNVNKLQQSLQKNPRRNDLRFRLLQLLANQKNVEGFIQAAEEAEPLLVHTPLWPSIIEMGQKLAPKHPLFLEKNQHFA